MTIRPSSTRRLTAAASTTSIGTGLAAKRRRDLVDRRIVTAVLVPLVDMSYSRVVSDAPVALTEQIVARVMSGGDDLKIDVEEMIRKELGGILSDCRDSMAHELEQLEG